MHIFISAGEPSGDLHGANLIRALRQTHPGITCIGFGGEHMEAAGCRLLYPLCRLAVMWVLRVLANTHVFLRLLAMADRYFHDQRPDAVVLIDYPGFNWWLARRARRHGIPVFYFVPPQLWAWAGWRVRKMRRYVDHVLCTLPFEQEWYQARAVSAHYVGHPYFDELAEQQLDAVFVAGQQSRPGTIIGLLPGSRNQEIERNLSTLLQSAGRIHAARPDTRFLVACLHPAQRDFVAGRLPLTLPDAVGQVCNLPAGWNPAPRPSDAVGQVCNLPAGWNPAPRPSGAVGQVCNLPAGWNPAPRPSSASEGSSPALRAGGSTRGDGRPSGSVRGLPIEVCAGRTPEIIHLAHACIAVSGSVGLELLYRGKPSVVVYRVRRIDLLLCRLLKTAPYISLVNLLAGRELFPEFLTHRDETDAIAGHVLRWLEDAEEYRKVCAELAGLRERVAIRGACERAARYVSNKLQVTSNSEPEA